MEDTRDANPPVSQTIQCKGGCGFYGSSATDGFCSKCFKESLKRQQDPDRRSPNLVCPPSGSLISEGRSSSPSAFCSVPAVEKLLPNVELNSVEDRSDVSSEGESSSSSIVSNAAPVTDNHDAEGSIATSEQTPSTKKRNRCQECNKRVGLTGFGCRCGGIFCGLHRYSDTHNCPFDYKKLGKEEIRKNNPLVEAQKVQKI